MNYNYPPEQHKINSIEQLPNSNNLPTLDNDVFRNYGGIILTILLCISTIVFLILFYDSMCIEKLANAKLNAASATKN